MTEDITLPCKRGADTAGWPTGRTKPNRIKRLRVATRRRMSGTRMPGIARCAPARTGGVCGINRHFKLWDATGAVVNPATA